MDEKTRKVRFYAPQPWESHYNANYLTDPSPGEIATGMSSAIEFVETTQSRGHAWPPGKASPSTDLGGNFTTTKITELSNYSPGIFYGSRISGRRYVGPAWPISPNAAANRLLSIVKPSDDFKLNQLGTTAIARCLPTNPVVDGGTALAELKNGIPKFVGKELLKTKFKDYRKYGSEYINFQFGWKPIVSDLKNLAKAVNESDKIIQQLHRDSGRNIHRKFTFPDEVTVVNRKSTGQYCYIPSGLALSTKQYDGTGTLYTTEKTTVRTWFSGCFTYHINLGNTLQDRISREAAEARKLFGRELTPETLWNLAPWSWALDWEGSIGDVLHNITRFSQDGLVMRYGYIMQEKTCEIDYTLANGGGIKTGQSNLDLRFTMTAKSKVRRRATPFGFGFDMKNLSGSQSAILGALGISRGPRHL